MWIIVRTYISIKTAEIIPPNAVLTIIRGPPNQDHTFTPLRDFS